jgi:hypothetical protein
MLSPPNANEVVVVTEVFEKYIIAASITRDIEMDQYERIKILENAFAIQSDQIAVQSDQIAILTTMVTQLGAALFMNDLLSPNIVKSIRDRIFAAAETPLSEIAHVMLGLLNQWVQQSPEEP